MTVQEAKFEYLLRLGDSSLIIGHRLSEWCGHGPILEEDIALINIALDFVGVYGRGGFNGRVGKKRQVEGSAHCFCLPRILSHSARRRSET